MKKPLISVIVPVYNVEKFLVACIKSLISQDYKNYEIILVDDGSTDQSARMCDDYVKKYQNISVVHQKNHGLAHARNTGIKQAQGDFLTFVDSDDDVESDYLSYLYQMIEKHKVKMSIASFLEISPKHQKNWGAHYNKPKVLTQEQCLERMLNEKGFNMTAWGKLYHKDLFQKVKFPEGAIHEDVATTYKCVLQCDKVAYGPKPKYNYYLHQSSITNQKFSSQKLVLIDFTDAMCDEIDKKFPSLRYTTQLRRMHGRFSILRQMVSAPQLTNTQKELESQIIRYLKLYNHYILENPKAKPRDFFAMRTLMMGVPMFKVAWKLYELVNK